MQQKRILSPYERTQLQEHNIPESVLLETQSPVEYLTHHVEFCNLDFYVDESVLIPRIETEELVNKALFAAKEIFTVTNQSISIADVGTGSGAIAIALASQLETHSIPYKIFATDVSIEALEVAKKNKNQIGQQHNIQFLTSNLLEAFLINEKFTEEKFDLIVSNLPYIPSARIPQLDESVINYEPKLALDGGETGLELIHQLIKQAQQVAKNYTQILLEVDYTHTHTDFIEHSENWNIIVDTNTDGVRFVTLERKKTP